MKNFSRIVDSMICLLKGKGDMIDWTSKCDLSFKVLKSTLIQTPILTIVDLSEENII